MPYRYNGIDLGAPQTVTYEMLNANDPSNTDRLYTTFRFGVSSLLADGVPPILDGISETAAEKAKRIEHILLTPRRRFVVEAIDGTVMLDLDQDDANGPMPISCTVKSVHEGCWQVLWACEVKLSTCSEFPPSILSLRYSTTIDYAEDHAGTRVTQGLLILSSRSLTPADEQRALITPDVPPGYRRARASYAIDETGLQVRFNFRDTQLHHSPPRPATSIRGDEGMHATSPGGIVQQFISLKLNAPPRTSTRELFTVGIAIVESRARRSAVRAGSNYLMDLRVSKSISDNETSLSIVASWQMAQNRPLQLELREWLSASIPGDDPERAIAPPVNGVGDFPLRLVAAALRDPCLRDDIQGIESELQSGQRATAQELTRDLRGGGQLQISLVPATESQTLPAESALQDDTPGAYVWWDCTSYHTRNEGLAVLPSTAAGPAKVVRLHQPTHKLRCEWTAKRIGGPPEIPSPQVSDSNIVLTSSTVAPQSRQVGPDGKSFVYTVSGVFDYAYLDPSRVEVTEPMPPFLSDQLRQQSALALSLADSGILFQNGGAVAVNPWTGDGQQIA